MAREEFKELTDDLLLEIIRKSLLNVQSLIDDGDLLLQNGRYPRASVMYQLANEESGKALLCFLRLIFDYNNYSDHLAEFNESFFDHIAKSKKVMVVDFFFARVLYQGKPKEMKDFLINKKEILGNMNAYELNDMKNYSLYTSLKREKVVIPDELITEQIATNMQLIAKARYSWTQATTKFSEEYLLTFRQHLRENPINHDDMIKQLVDEMFELTEETEA